MCVEHKVGLMDGCEWKNGQSPLHGRDFRNENGCVYGNRCGYENEYGYDCDCGCDYGYVRAGDGSFLILQVKQWTAGVE